MIAHYYRITPDGLFRIPKRRKWSRKRTTVWSGRIPPVGGYHTMVLLESRRNYFKRVTWRVLFGQRGRL